MEIVIWWIDQKDCEAIGKEFEGYGPDYLKDEYRSRFARPGRGRLWVDKQFGNVSVDPWPDTPLAKRLTDDHGGIVMRFNDMVYLLNVPGIITDRNLIRVGHPIAV